MMLVIQNLYSTLNVELNYSHVPLSTFVNDLVVLPLSTKNMAHHEFCLIFAL